MDRRLFLKHISITTLMFKAPYLFANTDDASFADRYGNPNISDIKAYMKKMSRPDIPDSHDLYVRSSEREVFNSAYKKLSGLLYKVGYVKFSALDISQASAMVSFSSDELDYLKKLFTFDASNYGFYGDKPLTNFEARIQTSNLTQANGILCFDGKTLNKFKKIKEIIGDDVYMTSGIRSVVKQTYLFMYKTRQCDYNLSMASRTVAPPGYSYHGVGDFDIGSKKLSLTQNFTDRFADTDVFKQAAKDGFISLRYGLENKLGVRYEPWHVKV
jgi:hypothetical protein